MSTRESVPWPKTIPRPPGVETVLGKNPLGHFEVGLCVGTAGWKWHKLDVKEWPAARRRAQDAVAVLLREAAREILEDAEQKLARGSELRTAAEALHNTEY